MFRVGKSEGRNLLRRCLDPRMVWSVSVVFGQALVRRLTNRLLHGRGVYYPRGVIECVAEFVDDARLPLGKQALSVSLVPPEGPQRLRLAVGYLEFIDVPPWRSTFPDEEQFVSLHRWNWLLRAMTDEVSPVSAAWGEHWVRSWLSELGTLPPGPASESYTVGERIANLCLFARMHYGNWCSLPEDLASSLYEMAHYLVHRIEYQPGDLTGNHVVNNSRALLMVGHTLGLPRAVDLARELLRERLPILMPHSGFLREGSSHYQFLFTRWLIECWLVAREMDDGPTLAILEHRLPKLLSACRFFLVADGQGGFHMPTFGDVSPDYDPEWLIDVPLIAEDNWTLTPDAKGWGAMIRCYFASTITALPTAILSENDSWQCHPEAGWFRLDYEHWVAIWHAEAAHGPSIGSHAHHDFGSMVLFRNGHEVLIDPGRLNYEPASAEGNHCMSAAAHTTVLLDGLGPMLSPRDRFVPMNYRAANIQIAWSEEGNTKIFTIRHEGFSRRAGGGGTHTRRFLVSKSEVRIEDSFTGDGERKLDFFMQFAADGEIDAFGKSGVHFSSDLDETDFTISWVKEGTLAGWRYPAYGVRQSARSFHAYGHVTLPFQCCCRILASL